MIPNVARTVSVLAPPVVLRRAHEVLAAADTQDLHDLVLLLRQETGADLAAITVYDGGCFYFDVCADSEPFEAPYAEALCRHSLGLETLFECADLTADPRFQHSAHVTGEKAGLRAYASWPLMTATGEHLGRVCLFQQSPRTLDRGPARSAGHPGGRGAAAAADQDGRAGLTRRPLRVGPRSSSVPPASFDCECGYDDRRALDPTVLRRAQADRTSRGAEVRPLVEAVVPPPGDHPSGGS